MNNVADTLKSRWAPHWSQRRDLSKLQGAFNAALHFAESMPNKRADLARPGDLSAKGLNEAMRRTAVDKAVPALRRAAWDAEKTAIALKAERRALSVPKPDPNDVAGAVLRSEIRSYLRTLNVGERMKAVMDDPEFLAAAFEGPAALSGLTAEHREAIEARIVEEAQGAALAAINDGKAAVELVQAAVEVAMNIVRTECGFEEEGGAFEEWVAQAGAGVEREIAAERAAMQKPARPDARLPAHQPASDEFRAEFNEIWDRSVERVIAERTAQPNGADGEAA